MPTVAPNVTNSVRPRRKLLLMRDRKDSKVINEDFGIHEVYVPSDLGGRLRIGFFPSKDHVDHELVVHRTDGRIVERDAATSEARIDFAPGERGDGNFVVSIRAPSGKYRVYALFEEVGFARGDHSLPLVPWNFWYYPFGESSPDQTAYASSSVDPLGHYEQAFGVTGAKLWEEQHHADPAGLQPSWAGHCHNAAPASILFQQPPAGGVEHNNVKFSCEELKYLATEFYGSFGLTLLTWRLRGKGHLRRHGSFQERKPSEAPRLFGRAEVLPKFLEVLRFKIRDEGRALVVDLRDANGVDHEAVWSQAVYGYRTKYWQKRASDPALVEGETLLLANQDMWTHGVDSGVPATLTTSDDGHVVPTETTTGREQLLRFRLRFRNSGDVHEDSKDNLWRSVVIVPNDIFPTPKDIFAPRFAYVVGKPWPVRHPSADGNPEIVRDHVLELLPLRGIFE